MTIEEFEKLNVLVLGNDDRRDYYNAIIGIAKDNSHVVYSKPKLIQCFMTAYNWSYDEALEWIEYNAERALPYYDNPPVIVDSNNISSRNKTYNSIRIE
jgi:hypothetical protein